MHTFQARTLQEACCSTSTLKNAHSLHTLPACDRQITFLPRLHQYGLNFVKMSGGSLTLIIMGVGRHNFVQVNVATRKYIKTRCENNVRIISFFQTHYLGKNPAGAEKETVLPSTYYKVHLALTARQYSTSKQYLTNRNLYGQQKKISGV